MTKKAEPPAHRPGALDLLRASAESIVGFRDMAREAVKNEDHKTTYTEEPAQGPVQSSLNRHAWQNWFFLVGVLIVTAVGLATAIHPLLSKRIIDPWPWSKTDQTLLTSLLIMILSIVVYLSRQQRRILHTYWKLLSLQEKAAGRSKLHYSRLLALLNLSRLMGSEPGLQSVFDCITELCIDTFTCQRASLMLYDKESQVLVVRSASGRACDKLIGIEQNIGEGIAGWAAKHREALFLSRNCDLKKYPGLNVKDLEIMAAMVVPIVVRGELVGVLNISTKLPNIEYDGEDLKALVVFAETAGFCIRHTERTEWMRKTIHNLQK